MDDDGKVEQEEIARLDHPAGRRPALLARAPRPGDEISVDQHGLADLSRGCLLDDQERIELGHPRLEPGHCGRMTGLASGHRTADHGQFVLSLAPPQRPDQRVEGKTGVLAEQRRPETLGSHNRVGPGRKPVQHCPGKTQPPSSRRFPAGVPLQADDLVHEAALEKRLQQVVADEDRPVRQHQHYRRRFDRAEHERRRGVVREVDQALRRGDQQRAGVSAVQHALTEPLAAHGAPGRSQHRGRPGAWLERHRGRRHVHEPSLDRLDPDVAVLDRVAVVLQEDRAVVALGCSHTARSGGNLRVIDDLDAVLDHGDARFLRDLPVR